jgi:hypothetical protein
MNKKHNKHTQLKRIALAIASLSYTATGHAFLIDTGNPDLTVRWDNNVRYNLGMRVEGRDDRLMNDPSGIFDDGDGKFGRGDVVTNRVDLLSELDLAYAQRLGFRVTASLWYDQAYDDHRMPGDSPYASGKYSGTGDRYLNGPSGEFLDAFVWANLELGEVPVNVKMGKHSVLWGESLLLGFHALSYSQSPIDGLKASSSPGIETKEVFMPINQFSFSAQLTDDLTLLGQYAIDWKPFRSPVPGSYLMGADFGPGADQFNALGGVPLPPSLAGALGCTGMAYIGDCVGPLRVADPREPKDGKNWGIGLKAKVAAMNSELGFYYREFDDTIPETGVLAPTAAPFGLPTYLRMTYAEDVRIVGVSLATNAGPVSIGSELSYRRNGHLTSLSSYPDGYETGARGNTWHAIINGLYLLPRSAFWDTGSILAELGYSRLDKVTRNKELYRGEGYTACDSRNEDKHDGCATRDYVQIAVNFTPEYLQILPGMDLKLPMTVNYGIQGNAPSGNSGNEGALSWSIGAVAMYLNKYEFGLRYADRAIGDIKVGPTGLVSGNGTKSSIGATDRGYLNFTFKTSF